MGESRIMALTEEEIDYYTDRMNTQEIVDWAVLNKEYSKGKMSAGLWKGIYDSFWDCVKERVDNSET